MLDEQNRLHLIRSLRARVAMACALLAIVALFSVPSVPVASAQDGTETATPAATPTPSPPDLPLAAQLAYEGKFESAVGAYQAVIEQGSLPQRLVAHVGLAQLYLDDGQTAAAVRELDAYLLEAPDGTDVRDAQYLLAEALSQQGDWAEALPLYNAYIAAGGGVAVYAWLGRAVALTELGYGPGVATVTELLFRGELPDAAHVEFILAVAQALEASEPESALVWYERLGRESIAPEDQALVLWRSAQLRRRLDRDASLIDAWNAVLQQYPATSTAQAIVDRRPFGATTLDSYYVGLAYFRGGRNDEARTQFEASLEANQDGGDPSLAAKAAYYLAVLDEGAGDAQQAIDGYGRVVELDPRVELADDALWWQGRLLEQAGRLGDAADSYQRLVAEYDGSDWAAEGSFRLVLLDYDAGRYDDAAGGFAAIARGAQNEERARAVLWLGKAQAAAGDDIAADATWTDLAKDAPDEYYGLRAAILLGDADGRLRDVDLDNDEPADWAAIETWLAEALDLEPPLLPTRILSNRHLRLGKELLDLGLRGQAGDEFNLVLEGAGRDPVQLYHLTRAFQALDLAEQSSRAATRLLFAPPDEARETATADLWRVAYPAPYAALVEEVADERDVPGLLLLAVARQESFFDPLAGSTAGALGLLQVIPPTGEAIAEELGLEDFELQHLYRPAVSLDFGAHYLAAQLDRFDGNLYHALAAYNGGPTNAQRWRGAAGDDVDRFVAEIEFGQTTAYVRLVMENLARYRQLYQRLDGPELPAD